MNMQPALIGYDKAEDSALKNERVFEVTGELIMDGKTILVTDPK